MKPLFRRKQRQRTILNGEEQSTERLTVLKGLSGVPHALLHDRFRDDRLCDFRVAVGAGDPLCFLHTVGLTLRGFPEILAVDVDVASIQNVMGCMHLVADTMVRKIFVGGAVAPDNFRFTLPSDGGGADDASYFAALHVTDATKRKILHESMVKTRQSNNLLLLVPMCQQARSWGQMYEAPGGKAELRNAIKEKLEKQEASLGFTRHIAPENDTTNSVCDVVAKVRLEDALAHPEWKVNWAIDLNDEEIEYVRKNREYFASLSIDGLDASLGDKYIDQLCGKAQKVGEFYKRGLKIDFRG